MDEILKPAVEYINTALGVAALGAATFAANWVRKAVGRYFAYLEAKRRRWKEKGALFPKDYEGLTPEMLRWIEIAVVNTIKSMAADRRKNARTPTR